MPFLWEDLAIFWDDLTEWTKMAVPEEMEGEWGICPRPDCPIGLHGRGAGYEPRAGVDRFLSLLMAASGGDRTPLRAFLDMVNKVHRDRARPTKDVILTDPFIFADRGERAAYDGWNNLIEYLECVTDAGQQFNLWLTPSPQTASDKAEGLLGRTVENKYPRAKIGRFRAQVRFHDRFYLVRDGAAHVRGMFGPSLNGLTSDSYVLFGELAEPVVKKLSALITTRA